MATLSWTKDEVDFLTANFAEVSVNSLSNALNRTPASIRQKAMKLGLKKPLTVARERIATARNNDLFSTTDTSDKAYMLGLLCADGCVSDSRILLTLQERDALLVERARDMLSPETRLYRAKGKITLSFSSSRMVADLAKLGVTERKTFTLQYPPLPDALERDFLLGYFDGDGSLSAVKPRRDGHSPTLRWSMLGNESFLKSARGAIELGCGIAPLGPYRDRSIWRIVASCRKARLIDEWLNCSKSGLARKHL